MSKTSPTILATKDDAFEEDPLSEGENSENESEVEGMLYSNEAISSPISVIESPNKKQISPEEKEATSSKGSPPSKNQKKIEIKTSKRKLSASKKQLASTDQKRTGKSTEKFDNESIGKIYFDRAKVFEKLGVIESNSKAKFLKYMEATKNYLIAYQYFKLIIQNDTGPKLFRDTFKQIRQNILAKEFIKTLPFVQATFLRVGSLLAQKLHEQGKECVLHKRQKIKSLPPDLQEQELTSLAVEEEKVREFKEYSERQWTAAEQNISENKLSKYLQQAIDKDNCGLSKESKDTKLIIIFLNNCIDILKSNSNLK